CDRLDRSVSYLQMTFCNRCSIVACRTTSPPLVIRGGSPHPQRVDRRERHMARVPRCHAGVYPTAGTGYTAGVRPWQTVAEAEAPDRTKLVLSRRGDEYLIRAGGYDLMSSRDEGSARALAEIGCAALDRRAGVRVLIGGLGMGYSLAAALERLPADAEVEVAELVAAVVEWNRGELGELAGRPLD